MDKVQKFIKEIAPIIQYEALKRGYKVCSTVIAQAIIESRYGESGLAKYHNYFGLKCGSLWKGQSVNMKTKEEYNVGTLTTIKDNFRVYNSMQDGVKGYYDFINTKRYANLKQALNFSQYATMLKQDGYATSSTYVVTLVKTVVQYGLVAYDDLLGGNIFNAIQKSPYTIGKTYELQENLYVRELPKGNKLQYIDLTENAKLNSYTDDSGFAILKKGTKVTCKDVKTFDDSTWILIPSGWICGIMMLKEYVR